MGPIRKQDWGGRWGWALKTEVLQLGNGVLFQYIAILREMVYNIIFNTGVLQWAK